MVVFGYDNIQDTLDSRQTLMTIFLVGKLEKLKIIAKLSIFGTKFETPTRGALHTTHGGMLKCHVGSLGVMKSLGAALRS